MLSVDNYLYDGESVCIGRKGTIDKPVLLSGKFWTVDTLFYTHSFKNSLPKFIYAYFQTINWKNYNEASGVPSLSKTTIEQIDIKIPSISEQQKIADFLTQIDNKINQLSQKKQLLERYKKGVMQQIFSQSIRFTDDEGREFPEWEGATLDEVLDYEQPTKYLVSSTEYDNSYKIPVLTAGKTFILGYTNEIIGIYDTKLPVIIFDDFTTAFKFVKFPFKAKSSAMKILKTKSNANNIKFVYETMTILDFSVGDEHKRYWISEYSKQTIQLPCIEEQNKIANFLTAIDNKIALVEKQLNGTKQYKKGLLQQLFV